MLSEKDEGFKRKSHESPKTNGKDEIKMPLENKKREFGESLASCSDTEWDIADPAYASELINLKKRADKVTVFAGPTAKTVERTIIKTDSLSEELGMNKMHNS
uniref:Uncharacterized protein n=1 Tax=Setaria digitata TaxID=48799 RepID=A0A915PVW1_9BILA